MTRGLGLRRFSLSCALACLVGTAVGLGAAAPARAQTYSGFNVQTFRPTPGPRDLVIAPQSQTLAHLSWALGAYFSFSLDPLKLLSFVNPDAPRDISVVSNRLELDLMTAIGLGKYFEFGIVQPVVLFQTSDDLSDLGNSGPIQSTVLGDTSFIPKVTFLRRLPYAKGFGVAMNGRLDVPVGGEKSQAAFASNGTVTFTPSLIADYRFGNGALITLSPGILIRKVGEFGDIRLGPSFVAALGAEMPLIRKWGLTILGGANLSVPLVKQPDPPPSVTGEKVEKRTAIPSEGMLAIRWYSSIGVTFTTGFNFGFDCSFSVPRFRYFLAAVFVPNMMKEAADIEDFKKPPDDPDGDGVIGEADFCPEVKGPVENHGCPEADRDRDGIPDRVDECPELPGSRSYNGCPRVYQAQNKIMVLERVNFATDQDIILPSSFGVLEEVAGLIRDRKEWQQILVEAHTDARASDAYNLDLSQRRASAVMRFLLARGIEPSRLRAQGFGKARPIAPNQTPAGSWDEAGMALNRRVEFTILKVAPPTPAAPLQGGTQPPGPAGGSGK